MTAKERVLAEAPAWTEEQAEIALRAVAADGGGDVQPPFSLIGAFRSARDDLGQLASRDVYEPEPFR